MTIEDKRHKYSIEELRDKRSEPSAQEVPTGLEKFSDIYIVKSLDPYNTFIREIRLILNKLTPQTYDKLLQKLDKLELDGYERLQGMIDIFFFKAVEEPKFCFMYASLCKHFQKKHVIVSGQDGQTVTYYFRQILLARCQTKFETDYRQDIDYDRRKKEVDAITNEKHQKEEAENLEEALFKAKRRHFGNILFIGELFKLGMLTEPIMFDCMDYFLQGKADEENLECLCKLLRAIGKELDNKVTDKTQNRKKLENNYSELENIVTQPQISPRTRFMIQDLMDLRKANWVARIPEVKPMTIDEIHDQERHGQQHQDQYQNNGVSGNNSQQYTVLYGSRDNGIKQQSNRINVEQNERCFNANPVRQYQTDDKQNPTLNLVPQCAWFKASTIEKKPEDNRANMNR